MRRNFLYKIEKTGTGKLPVHSSAIVDEESANKLHWIFQNFAGQREDFKVFFDEFQTQRIPLSHFFTTCKPLAPMEESILKKHGLDRTGIVSPLDLLEDFEALMGEILFDEDLSTYHLEGELDSDVIEEEEDEEDMGEDHVEVKRPKGKGSIII